MKSEILNSALERHPHFGIHLHQKSCRHSPIRSRLVVIGEDPLENIVTWQMSDRIRAPYFLIARLIIQWAIVGETVSTVVGIKP